MGQVFRFERAICKTIPITNKVTKFMLPFVVVLSLLTFPSTNNNKLAESLPLPL